MPRGSRPRQILNAPACGPASAPLANRPIGAAGFLGNLLIAPLRVVETNRYLGLGPRMTPLQAQILLENCSMPNSVRICETVYAGLLDSHSENERV
jgi:hypothetical protein